MLTKVLWLATAGALGTLARYGLSGVVQNNFSQGGFPLGTLAVNALGCFAFGLVWTLAEERLLISGELRTIVLIGFMGAFTTMSTFAFESAELMRDSEWALALINVTAQNAASITAVFCGLWAGRLI